MLSVRRPGVTNAVHVLEGDGFIKSLRKEVIIRHRDGLVQFADDAYGFPEREYSRLMGVMGADDGGINDQVFTVRIVRHRGEHAPPDALPAPAAETAEDTVPLAEHFRQVTPGR